MIGKSRGLRRPTATDTDAVTIPEPNNSPATDLKIAGDAFYQDSLKKIWEDDNSRSSDTYIKKQQFSYFLDSLDIVDRPK